MPVGREVVAPALGSAPPQPASGSVPRSCHRGCARPGAPSHRSRARPCDAAGRREVDSVEGVPDFGENTSDGAGARRLFDYPQRRAGLSCRHEQERDQDRGRTHAAPERRADHCGMRRPAPARRRWDRHQTVETRVRPVRARRRARSRRHPDGRVRSHACARTAARPP